MLVFSLTANAQYPEYPYDHPRKSYPRRINIEHLPLADHAMRTGAGMEKLWESYNSRTTKDFVATYNQLAPCWSDMRPGFKCVEFENTQIGYARMYFMNLGRYLESVRVIIDIEKGNFYVWPSFDHEKVYGPFKGNPQEEFVLAEIKRKESRDLTGIKFTYLSKRWKFPDERDAMQPRDGRYDYVGGMPSGREMEAAALNIQFFRFRLENNSDKDLVVLTHNMSPAVFKLYKFKEWKNWAREAPSVFYADWMNLNSYYWTPLPARSAFEFEVNTGCESPLNCELGITLNDGNEFYNEVEVTADFPGNPRRKFRKENEPPPRP